MREIKFRGKRADNNEWVYGYYYKGVMTDEPMTLNDARICHLIIADGTFFHVATESVGQFTGLLDKNGKEIYEGDIVRLNYANYPIEGIVKWFQGNRHPEDGCYGMEFLGWVLTKYKDRDPIDECYHMSIESVREVIGNIHENPELLDAGE